MTTSQFLGFEVTQRFLIDQTLDRIYRDWKAELALRFQRLSGQLMPTYLQRLLGSTHHSSIIEVNCGYGFLSNYVSLLFPQARVIGIEQDAAKASVAQGSIGNRRNLHFIAEEFSKVARLEADLIVINLPEWNEESALMLQRAYQWLTPGGDLLIRTRNNRTHWQKFLRLLTPPIISSWLQKDPWIDLDFLELRNADDWQQDIEANGLHCLAEYDATQADRNPLRQAMSFINGDTWFHAEKPLYPSAVRQQKPAKIYASPEQVKTSPFNKKLDFAVKPQAGEEIETGFLQHALQEKAPKQQQDIVHYHPVSKALSTLVEQTLKQPAAKPQTSAADFKKELRKLAAGAEHESDVLGYIFSKPWKCLSQELSAPSK